MQEIECHFSCLNRVHVVFWKDEDLEPYHYDLIKRLIWWKWVSSFGSIKIVTRNFSRINFHKIVIENEFLRKPESARLVIMIVKLESVIVLEWSKSHDVSCTFLYALLTHRNKHEAFSSGFFVKINVQWVAGVGAGLNLCLWSGGLDCLVFGSSGEKNAIVYKLGSRVWVCV